ncbi:MAG TPA: hypothetical protein ENG83_05800 [Nitrospirae bacterium]|nr:hypothetical protein BMS3Abin06_01901 [bacterium BMS3Abin06]HDH11696.1 hypothetical protein [Nitrospirota bacterium]HDZ03198.1 hypothetical protein [Nitrospirota bacterium]
MKKIMKLIANTIIISVLISLAATDSVNAGNIFQPEIEAAADLIVEAWIEGNTAEMKTAGEKLLRYEAYMIAAGETDRKLSYLRRLPVSLNSDTNKTAAYIFLLQQDQMGIGLLPKDLFEGQRFEFQQRRHNK